MEITRDVILDLLPLYVAGEVSENTRVLIEQYLDTDPDLNKLSERIAAMHLKGDIPVPLTQEDKMKSYIRARWITFLYVVLIAALISGTLLVMMAFFLISR